MRQRQLHRRARERPAHPGGVGVLDRDTQVGHGAGVGRSVGTVPADQFDLGLGERLPAAHRLPQGPFHRRRLRLHVEPREHERDPVPVTAQVVHGHLEAGRGWAAPDARHPNPIGALGGEGDGVEASGDVGTRIGVTGDLVEELGRDRLRRDQTPRSGVLGDDEVAVGTHLHEGESDVVETRHLGEEREVAPGDLGPALDQVPGHQGGSQPVPVVAGPSEVLGGGAHHHGGVGDPTGDDDVGAPFEGRGDAPAPQIGVGGDGGESGLLQPGAVPQGADLEVVDPGHEVVAGDGGHGGGEAESGGDPGQGLRQPGGVEAAGVGHHPDPALQARRHHLLHLLEEGAGVPGSGSSLTGAPQEGHGQLRQVVAGEVVDRPPLHHLPGGSVTVSQEPRAIGDAQEVHTRRR